MKQQAKREEQMERVMGATVGMYGDLQEIEGLNLIALATPGIPREDENGG